MSEEVIDYAKVRLDSRNAQLCAKCEHPAGVHNASDGGCASCACYGFVPKLTACPMPLPPSKSSHPWWAFWRWDP